jgi:hypothetical protein
MASTYSPLKIELIATGEQSGTWGTTTNTNLGTALEEAIVGSADVTFASGTVTLTLTDTNAAQTARNLRLNLTGTSGGAQNLIVPAIEKLYLVNNGCADAITVKNSSGTGIAVPAGKTMFVYNTGSNVVNATTHLSSLTLGSALPAGSGGTGITSLGTGVATWLGTPSSANLATAVTDETGSGSLVFATSPTLVTPILGTPQSGTLTNCTFPTLNQNTTGSAATFTSTSQNSQFNSVGVGTAASGTAGEIRATNNVTAYYSDERLKTKLGNIDNALAKLETLSGFYYEANEIAQALGYEVKKEVGVSAQEVQAVMPEVVAPAPIDDKYLTVRYERLVPLLIEAIKELSEKVKALEAK